jgi:hypothetical protein
MRIFFIVFSFLGRGRFNHKGTKLTKDTKKIKKREERQSYEISPQRHKVNEGHEEEDLKENVIYLSLSYLCLSVCICGEILKPCWIGL